jgi:hypothetical protein
LYLAVAEEAVGTEEQVVEQVVFCTIPLHFYLLEPSL